MISTEICCVVIPVYKQVLNDVEIKSFQQCVKILGKYPIILIAPQSLNMELYTQLSSKEIIIKRFNDFYFKTVHGYNQLMLSKQFYKSFIQYKYILIYQLDAWIFKDDLEYWCSRNYDYIGAPWIKHEWAKFIAGHLTFIRTIIYRLGYRNFNVVGNGGFSLRKVHSFILNLGLFKQALKSFKGNEDTFYSFYINSYNPFFKVASSKEALNFSFDIHPQECFKLNNFKLPMGCHGWNKYFDFWSTYIK